MAASAKVSSAHRHKPKEVVMPIAQQLTVTVANRPGALARIAEIMAGNKINIFGISVFRV